MKTLKDEKLRKFAQLLVERCLSLEKGDMVLIRTTPLALPLVKEVYRTALKKGAYPFIRAELEGLKEIFLKDAPEEVLTFLSPFDLREQEKVNAILTIDAPYNTKELTGVAPERQVAWQKARTPLSKIFMERDGRGDLHWCITRYPNNAHAQDAGMSLEDYADFVFSSLHLDEEDPIAYWDGVSKDQARLISILEKGKEIRVLGRGTDLTLQVEGRKWINADGRKNMPDGEIYTAPLEQSANGYILFSFPAIYQGREVEGVRLVFQEGKVIKAEAQKGEEYLQRVLNIDEGASYIGEFAFGTNYGIQKFTRDILFDEKIGGTLHIALGSAYPSTGGRNFSAIHWDMICDLREDSEIRLDGEVIQRDSHWLI
ncbi:MAG: aminopeptidase [bacterium]